MIDARGLDYLLARVNLLENEGSAQVVSRPTLLTQENAQAVIDHHETYYVKVTGKEVAELKGITYGTMLRMTPRVLTQGDKSEISLNLHIEDGNQNRIVQGLTESPLSVVRSLILSLAWDMARV